MILLAVALVLEAIDLSQSLAQAWKCSQRFATDGFPPAGQLDFKPILASLDVDNDDEPCHFACAICPPKIEHGRSTGRKQKFTKRHLQGSIHASHVMNEIKKRLEKNKSGRELARATFFIR